MRCLKMDEFPVYTEWQNKIYCPNCKYYFSGECKSPLRTKNTDACPMKNIAPSEQSFKFNVSQNVFVKTHNIKGEILNRKICRYGILYEIKTIDNQFWITEENLECLS